MSPIRWIPIAFLSLLSAVLPLHAAVTLVIAGTPANYGTPAPMGYGTNSSMTEGDWITNTVTSPANETNRIRRACLGWALTNTTGTIASDTGLQAVFQMPAANAFLTWNWTNEYQLVLPDSSNGAVSAGGWFTNGLQAQATATPDAGSVFLQWTGDVPAGSHTNNPLTVVMDQPRTIQAQFSTNTAAEIKQWTGTGNWTSWTNWSPAGMPGPEDNVLIKNGTVTLQDPTWMQSLIVSNGATLVASNWATVITVSGDVTIKTNGTVTTPVTIYRSTITNRVYLVCNNLTVEAGGQINVDAKGYGGGWAANSDAYSNSGGTGPGGGGYGGGSYGGRGGEQFDTLETSKAGNNYGMPDMPTGPGSGGGSVDGRTSTQGVKFQGGQGGGAVRIEAGGHVLVNGVITANGAAGTSASAAGSGGAVWITSQTIGGTNGIIRALGLDGNRGGGGGGRIAVEYDPAQQAALPLPALTLSTRGGLTTGVAPMRHADIGSLYFTDRLLLGSVITCSGQLFFGDVPLAFDNLTVSNGWIRFPDGDYTLTVTNDLTVLGSSGRLDMGGSSYYIPCGVWRWNNNASGITTLNVGGNLMLTNGGLMGIAAASTNAGVGLYGALVNIGGRIAIATNSWLILSSNPTNGGSPKISCNALDIQTGGCGIDASSGGFAGGRNSTGLGYGGTRYSGAGHGGRGGAYSASGYPYNSRGPVYAASNNVIHCGSGGGAGDNSARYENSAGYGGGLVRIAATNTMTINGTITAAGGAAGVNYSSGGSGGGIFLTCQRLAGGTNGAIRANGGGGEDYGGGGGGRIHVKRIAFRDTFAGSYAANGGSGGYQNGETGSIYVEAIPFSAGALFIVR